MIVSLLSLWMDCLCQGSRNEGERDRKIERKRCTKKVLQQKLRQSKIFRFQSSTNQFVCQSFFIPQMLLHCDTVSITLSCRIIMGGGDRQCLLTSTVKHVADVVVVVRVNGRFYFSRRRGNRIDCGSTQNICDVEAASVGL